MDIATTLAQFVRGLGSRSDPLEVLNRVVRAAASDVPGAERAGISQLDRRSIRTPAATDDLVRAIDLAQYESRQGPCIDAALDPELMTVHTSDLDDDERWPGFAARVAMLDVRSALSFKLYADAGTIGALNIYAAKPHAFTEEAVHIGGLFATHAALVLSASIERTQLTRALESRDLIGQAKGIVMERYKMTDAEAFDLLISVSQHIGSKLRDVAEYIATSGDIPAVDP